MSELLPAPSLHDWVRSLPEGYHGEVIDAQLHVQPRPSGRPALAAAQICAELFNPFGRGRGGPGGWLIVFEPEGHFVRGMDFAVPDLVGWGRERIGYARVSTEDQHLALQLDALKAAGCERVFEDKIGGTRTQRLGLDDALSHVREGDALVVWKLDRLGRGVKGLVDLVAELEQRQVHFRSLTNGIDTTAPAGRFFFHVMASLARMERELIAERTSAGLIAARRLSRVGGRKRRKTDRKIALARELLEGGVAPKDVEKDLGVSVPTLYRWLLASARSSEDSELSSSAP